MTTIIHAVAVNKHAFNAANNPTVFVCSKHKHRNNLILCTRI